MGFHKGRTGILASGTVSGDPRRVAPAVFGQGRREGRVVPQGIICMSSAVFMLRAGTHTISHAALGGTGVAACTVGCAGREYDNAEQEQDADG